LKPEVALRNLLEIMKDSAADSQYQTDSVLYRAQRWLHQTQGAQLVASFTTARMRTHALSTDHYATVAELAEQCPHEYGPAV